MQAQNEKWHADRALGIGGSDAAPALGMSKYSTPYQLYQVKIGEAEPQEQKWELLRGKALEPALRQHYADKTGRAVRIFKDAIVSQKYPFMRYNPDGVTECGRLCEFKTAAYGDGWGEIGSDEIPQEYILQVQHGLIVLGLEVVDVTVSIAANEPRAFVVEADRELQEMIIEGEAKFWECVTSRTVPDAISNDDVAKMYRRVNGLSVTATAEIQEAMAKLRLVRDDIKALEGDKETLEVVIKSFMGEAEILIADGGLQTLATWKQQKGARRIDADALRDNFPDVAEQVTKQGDPTRRFLLK